MENIDKLRNDDFNKDYLSLSSNFQFRIKTNPIMINILCLSRE